VSLRGSDDEVCAYIDRCLHLHRRPPTVRELGLHFDLSPARIHARLVHLKAAGRVSFEPRQPRTLHVVRRQGPDVVHVELTVTVDRQVYDTDAKYTAIAHTIEDVATRAVNGLLACRVQGVGRANGSTW